MKKFRSLSRLQQIIWIVCFTHFIALFVLFADHLLSQLQRSPRAILVKTYIPLSEKIEPLPATTTLSSRPQKSTKKKKEKPPEPLPIKKEPIKARKEEKQVRSEKVNKDAHTLKEIADSLESIAKSSEKIERRPQLTIPSNLKLKADIKNLSNNNGTYAELLISHLQNTLDLPEYGDVKAEIEIDASGAPLKCIILDSKSLKNSAFLKKRLPELTFPCFNDFGILDAQLTFTIIFRNSES